MEKAQKFFLQKKRMFYVEHSFSLLNPVCVLLRGICGGFFKVAELVEEQPVAVLR